MAGTGAAKEKWNWTTADRTQNTTRWKEACEYNRALDPTPSVGAAYSGSAQFDKLNVSAWNPPNLKLLHTDRWKKVFLEICEDDDIDQAVADIQLPADKAKAWVEEEKAIF